MRNPFRIREFRIFFDKMIELGSDNFSEFYHGFPRGWGPRYPRRGAGHRCGFWDGFNGIKSLYSAPGSYGYAAYRAGQELRKELGNV